VIAEGNPHSRQSSRCLLERHGYQADVAATGLSGFQAGVSRPHDPAVFLSERAELRSKSPTPDLYAELFQRRAANPILTARDWPYAAHTVFNAGACQVGEATVLLVRVEDRRGHSHLTVARSHDGLSNWYVDPRPSFAPDPSNYPEEAWGVEDPRLTWVEDREEWIVAYTAYSHRGPLVSLARTRDFVHFTRLGPVMPPNDKDAAVFPRRFGNRYAMIHRPVSPGSSGAHVWISFSHDLVHWDDHHLLMHARRGAWWDANKIGLSPPPLETKEGWLLLYHGVRTTAGGCLYRLGLALLDLEDPTRVLRRSDEWIFGPEMPYERQGDVNGVVFPCGWILDPESGVVRLYYGGADTCLALASAHISDLLDYVRRCPTPPARKRPSTNQAA
jgi:predicted GH43/DUF377 family glycosyl hydrolase